MSTYGILYTINPTFALLSNTMEQDTENTTQLVSPQVYFKKGPYGSLQEASKACTADNSVVASQNDVNDAYFTGANICQEGYTSNGMLAKTSQGTFAECNKKEFTTRLPTTTESQNIGVFCYGLRPDATADDVLMWDGKSRLASKFDWMQSLSKKEPQKCGTFSDEKYFKAYPDAKSWGQALKHWALEGINKKYKGFIKESDFTGTFDEQGYANLNQDKMTSTSSLQHLQDVGWKEDRRICLKLD
jgi:hypothetical protein